MNRKEKNKVFKVYVSDKCVCGNKKIKFRWTCKSCFEKTRNIKEKKKLALYCEKHISSAEKYLKIVKSLKSKKIS
ncbi:MAG: hypothetical protein AABX50_02055 [Nanoarchaeota archaeon]